MDPTEVATQLVSSELKLVFNGLSFMRIFTRDTVPVLRFRNLSYHRLAYARKER